MAEQPGLGTAVLFVQSARGVLPYDPLVRVIAGILNLSRSGGAGADSHAG
jgi:hypothetical protein